MDVMPPLFVAVFAALIAGSLASFAAVVVERVPAKETLWGVSHCVCGRELTATENLPVAGWLLTRGTARCCGTRIPVWYWLFEVVAAAAAFAAGLTAPWEVALAAAVLVPALAAAGGLWVRSADPS